MVLMPEVWEAVMRSSHPILQLFTLRPEKENDLNNGTHQTSCLISVFVFPDLYWDAAEGVGGEKMLHSVADLAWL